jgi:hypothetical protein
MCEAAHPHMNLALNCTKHVDVQYIYCIFRRLEPMKRHLSPPSFLLPLSTTSHKSMQWSLFLILWTPFPIPSEPSTPASADCDGPGPTQRPTTSRAKPPLFQSGHSAPVGVEVGVVGLQSTPHRIITVHAHL